MYVLVPTNVLATELISSPDTPKSQILISPFELTKMFDGLISVAQVFSANEQYDRHRQCRVRLTSMHDPVLIIQIRETPQNGLGDLAYNVDRNRAMLLVDTVERSIERETTYQH
jgi:hypothetical protein